MSPCIHYSMHNSLIKIESRHCISQNLGTLTIPCLSTVCVLKLKRRHLALERTVCPYTQPTGREIWVWEDKHFLALWTFCGPNTGKAYQRLCQSAFLFLTSAADRQSHPHCRFHAEGITAAASPVVAALRCTCHISTSLHRSTLTQSEDGIFPMYAHLHPPLRGPCVAC